MNSTPAGGSKVPHPFDALDLSTIESLADGSAILFALARLFKDGGADSAYVERVTRAADAVYDALDTYPQWDLGALYDFDPEDEPCYGHCIEINRTLLPLD